MFLEKKRRGNSVLEKKKLRCETGLSASTSSILFSTPPSSSSRLCALRSVERKKNTERSFFRREFRICFLHVHMTPRPQHRIALLVVTLISNRLWGSNFNLRQEILRDITICRDFHLYDWIQQNLDDELFDRQCWHKNWVEMCFNIIPVWH